MLETYRYENNRETTKEMDCSALKKIYK